MCGGGQCTTKTLSGKHLFYNIHKLSEPHKHKDVGEKQKKEAVLEVFHNVADSYDLMNDAMSLGNFNAFS